MLRKSKIVAVLSVCIMMFAAVQPAFAWWGEDTAYGGAVGGATGGFWGAVCGAVVAGVAVVATGGLAAIPLAGAAIGGAALTGATYGAVGGAVTGAVVGAVADKETVNTAAKIASIAAPIATVGYVALPVIGTAIGGAAAAGTATTGAGLIGSSTAELIGTAGVGGAAGVVAHAKEALTNFFNDTKNNMVQAAVNSTQNLKDVDKFVGDGLSSIGAVVAGNMFGATDELDVVDLHLDNFGLDLTDSVVEARQKATVSKDKH